MQELDCHPTAIQGQSDTTHLPCTGTRFCSLRRAHRRIAVWSPHRHGNSTGRVAPGRNRRADRSSYSRTARSRAGRSLNQKHWAVRQSGGRNGALMGPEGHTPALQSMQALATPPLELVPGGHSSQLLPSAINWPDSQERVVSTGLVAVPPGKSSFVSGRGKYSMVGASHTPTSVLTMVSSGPST